jgi:hypothetical protein
MIVQGKFYPGNVMYYIGNNSKQVNSSKHGFVKIIDGKIIENWIGIKYINCNLEFGCQISELKEVLTETKLLKDYGFECTDMNNLCKTYTYHVPYLMTIKIYHSINYGFYSIDLENENEYYTDTKKFYYLNYNLNDLNNLCRFLSQYDESKSVDDILDSFLKMLPYE